MISRNQNEQLIQRRLNYTPLGAKLGITLFLHFFLSDFRSNFQKEFILFLHLRKF